MVHDLKQLLRETADRPVHGIDTAHVVRTGRRRRHAKRAGALAVGVAVLAGLVLVGASFLPGRRGNMTVLTPGKLDAPATSPSTVEATPSLQETSLSRPPASCPVTIPQGDFTPPEQYGPVGEGNEWYGSEDLWVRLDQDGDVWLPDDYPHLKRRVVLWSVHQGEPSEEPNPPVRLTAERLDVESPPVSSDEWTTHGWTNSRAGRNLFMFALITLPAPGCWEITAEYRDAALSWVVWATDTT